MSEAKGGEGRGRNRRMIEVEPETGLTHHPYRRDILLAFVLAPALAAIETWRRWGDLLAVHTFDDYGMAALLAVSGWLLLRRHVLSQDLWVFTWGAAACLMLLSFFAQLEGFRESDPSGLPVPLVLGVKGAMLGVIFVMSRRAFRLSRSVDFRGGPTGARPDGPT